MANQALREGDLLQSTAIMHEMSHGQDALSMTKQDFEDYATDLYETSKSDARLESISNGAIRMRTTGTLMEGSKLKLEDESRAYDPINNPILPMDQQDQLAQDEYLKAYQDILKHNKAARKVAAKYGQGLGNLWRGMTGRNKGNYIAQ